MQGGAPALAVSSADVSSTGATAEEREEAVRRLQRAAGDIASAFTTLGIFGSATTVSAGVVLFVALLCARFWPSIELNSTHFSFLVLTSPNIARIIDITTQNRVP